MAEVKTSLFAMPLVGDVFYERYFKGPNQGKVDPAFIGYFTLDTSQSKWRHGRETRVISWLPLARLAENITTAYIYNHPDAESDEVLQFLDDCFSDLTMTLHGSSPEVSSSKS